MLCITYTRFSRRGVPVASMRYIEQATNLRLRVEAAPPRFGRTVKVVVEQTPAFFLVLRMQFRRVEAVEKVVFADERLGDELSEQ